MIFNKRIVVVVSLLLACFLGLFLNFAELSVLGIEVGSVNILKYSEDVTKIPMAITSLIVAGGSAIVFLLLKWSYYVMPLVITACIITYLVDIKDCFKVSDRGIAVYMAIIFMGIALLMSIVEITEIEIKKMNKRKKTS